MASEKGVAAQKRAAKFRRREVELKLKRLIARQEIKVYFGKHISPRDPEAYSPPEPNLGQPFDQHDFERIHIQKSVAGARLHSKREIWIDAIELINGIVQQVDPRGRSAGSDWAKIEREIRSHFENFGTGNTTTELEKLFLRYGEPRRETFRKLVGALRAEYDYAK
jgi:uncharacterized ferritin-like protein (DUF455 family)